MLPYDQSEHRELAVVLHRAEVADAYIEKARSERTADRVGLKVGTFDINDDGTDEIFSHEDLMGLVRNRRLSDRLLSAPRRQMGIDRLDNRICDFRERPTSVRLKIE